MAADEGDKVAPTPADIPMLAQNANIDKIATQLESIAGALYIKRQAAIPELALDMQIYPRADAQQK
jgi:hypothetical protein